MDRDAVIRVDHLSHRYGATEALSDVCLEVRPGEIFGLVGPDGAGKTTFLRILACLLTPSGGSAAVGGWTRSAIRPA